MSIKTTWICLLLLTSSSLLAQKPWQEIKTVADLNQAYPELVKKLFAELDLSRQGLEKSKRAYEQGNIIEASQELLAYYRVNNNAAHLREKQPIASGKSVAAADTVLKNVFTIQNVKGKVPYGDDGHRDWYYKGPNNDREWAWLSNRHSQINQIFSIYLETGNPKYVRYIDEFLRDFIIKSLPYPEVKTRNSIWRGLEVAARIKVWSRIFYGLIDNPDLSPATRLLILISLPDHAHYNRNFHGGNNWLTMEISALATVATNFPEYEKSEEWLSYAVETMTESMKNQVYEDGVQTELTSHYHNVSLRNFALFREICDRAGKVLPKFFTQTIEAMFYYIASAIRPDGNRILNNDGDRGSDREIILAAAERFQKPTWTYVATNGQSGTLPSQGPSYFYPWAGQLISRSGYDIDAHWSFFDIGPWGSGHQHNDKLHLSIAAYGRDLLVDAGRFAYTGATAEKFRPYARSSAAHNTILIDGKGQAPGPEIAYRPLGENHFKITTGFDYASGSFTEYIDLEGEASHIRSLMYVRGAFWIIVDKITTDRPRSIDVLWHWHPDCVVEIDGSIVNTKNDRGNLAIIPVGQTPFEISLVEGQEEPEIQGWYSPEYNIFYPNAATQYRTDIGGNHTFVWLLTPGEKKIPKVECRIIHQGSDEVKLAVQYGEKSVEVNIPFINSKAASLLWK